MARCARHPPIRAAPDFPLFRGQNKTPRNTLFISRTTISTGYSAPACEGKVVAPATKRGGEAFPRPQGGCMFFAAKGGIKNGAEGAVPPQWNGTSYLPRAEPSTRPGGVSRSRTEPLAPRAKGPAAPSTLARESGRQPSGILESTVPIPTAPPVTPGNRKLACPPALPHPPIYPCPLFVL